MCVASLLKVQFGGYSVNSQRSFIKPKISSVKYGHQMKIGSELFKLMSKTSLFPFLIWIANLFTVRAP